MKKLSNMLRILELVWLIIGATGLAAFIYAMLFGRKDQAIYFLIFTIIAGLMFAVRRKQRKNSESTKQ